LDISDNLFVSYLEANEKIDLEGMINKDIFKVSDTSLSYRQINSLDNVKLLSTHRLTENGWRKFSFKEIIYIEIVTELKKFGLEHSQLKELCAAFFDEPSQADIAIGLVLGGVEITLTVNTDGQVRFYDPLHYLYFGRDESSLIRLNLNLFVNRLRKKIGQPQIPVVTTMESITKSHNDLTAKESEIIKIIRDNTYRAIKIKKKNNEIETVYTEKVKPENQKTTNNDIIKILNAKDYQTITIAKGDGKIVNLRVEETFKP